LLPQLTNAKVFTVADAKNGFWHVPLDEESSYLTTFATPWGRYRWNRLPFGLSPAPEEFQRRLEDALNGLENVQPIYDDILIHGSGDTIEEATADHDRKLCDFLQRCREKGVKFNKDKLKFRQEEVTFMGHTISAAGLKADATKIDAIINMPTPKNKQDVKRLLGTINYLQRFAPNLSSVTTPLRELLQEDVMFTWEPDVHGTCLQNLKELLTSPPVLRYFNHKEEVQLQCDASDKGLGACLMQGGQPVAYASRSLTKAKQQYAQIEKEMLVIVFGTEKFHEYVYGRTTQVETDHKPLEAILKKSILSAPKRLQRMMLRLQRYDLHVTYKPGKHMYLADTLSRAYLSQPCDDESEEENVILFIDTRSQAAKDVESINMRMYLAISDDTLTKVKQASKDDPEYATLQSMILQGWPEDLSYTPEALKPYFPFRDELSIEDGLVFKGERLVIPCKARAHFIMRIHSSHIGIQGCLRRARKTVYWPRMNQEISEAITKCTICNNFPKQPAKEPLINDEIPIRPWEKIACDIQEINSISYLITVDYFSSFFEIDRLTTKTGKEIIGKLKQHLARHGLPDVLMSDNGPPFNSSEFKEFASKYAFKHVTSSPGYAQSNGKVENAVKTSKNLIHKAMESKSDPYLALLDWRNTPTEGFKTSPAQRLFSRRTRTLLPTTVTMLHPKVPTNTVKDFTASKIKQAFYYNRGAKDLPPLQPGDSVRVKPLAPHSKGKRWPKACAQEKVGIRSYCIKTDDGRELRRNRRHLVATPESNVTDLEEPEPCPASEATSESENITSEQPSTDPDQLFTRSRSGRAIRPPSRFNDFVVNYK